MNTLKNALCERLGIEVPIYGFSHSAAVTVAIAECGGFPVFGAARAAAGQSVAWFNTLTTVREIMERLAREAREALGHLQRSTMRKEEA